MASGCGEAVEDVSDTSGVVNSLQFVSCPQDTIAGFTWAQRRTEDDDAATPPARATSLNAKSLLLVAGVGQEMRLGRWVQKKGEGVLNGALVVALHTRTAAVVS